MSEPEHHGRHEAPDSAQPAPTESFWAEFRDAVSPRSLILGVGTGMLCLGFILSYLGAFHDPRPHQVPVAVVAPVQVSDRLVAELNGIAGQPVAAHAVASKADGFRQLTDDTVAGVFIVNPTGHADQLLVASGGGTTQASALRQVFSAVDATQRRTVTVTDVVPHQPGDSTGGSVFYLVLGCVLAGYLLAASISSARGTRPATFRRTLWRLGMTIPYAVIIGLGAAIITDPVLDVITGHFGTLWAVGALLVLSAATVTIAFQILFGFMGIALTILIFVILGSPTAGGAYPYRLLPPFWRELGPWLPNGAGVDVLRRAVYFDGAGMAARLWVVAGWALVGALIAIAASRTLLRRAPSSWAQP